MRNRFLSLGLFSLSGLLFAVSFPTALAVQGLFPLAFIFLGPAVVACGLVESLPLAALGGASFGAIGYGVCNYWLFSFDPLAPLFVLPVNMIEYGFIFLAIAIVRRAMPRWGWVFAIPIWVAGEYLKTLGFLGYPFGVIGYSLASFLPLAQAASVGGVWLLSAVAVAPQLAFFWSWKPGMSNGVTTKGRAPWRRPGALPTITLAACVVTVAVWGSLRISGQTGAQGSAPIIVTLVQPCREPGQKGAEHYSLQLHELERLTNAALGRGTNLIVWPETAIIPSIEWHLKYRPDPRVYQTVAECLDYIRATDLDFVLGNGHGQVDPQSSNRTRVDFNAALAFPAGSDSPSIYEKQRLVPFTEYFPFGGALAGLREFLLEREDYFFTPGFETAPLPVAGILVSTPICFEDGFGYLARDHALQGAKALVPIIDDSWSRSVAEEYQHLQCSIIRCIETGLPMARCANSGITCIIDPAGRIVSGLKPFEQGALTGSLPAAREGKTPYLLWGDIVAAICLAVSLGGLALSAFLLFKRRRA